MSDADVSLPHTAPLEEQRMKRTALIALAALAASAGSAQDAKPILDAAGVSGGCGVAQHWPVGFIVEGSSPLALADPCRWIQTSNSACSPMS